MIGYSWKAASIQLLVIDNNFPKEKEKEREKRKKKQSLTKGDKN